MSWADHIRISAMASVVRQDSDYVLRRMFRWYSQTFATPLHVVENLPMEDIIRTYWEAQYEEMSEEDRAVEIGNLTETDESLTKRKVAEDAEDAESFEYAKEADEEKKPEPVPPQIAQIDEMTKVLTDLSETIKSSIPEVQPDITMKFIETDEEFERLLDRGFGPPPKPKKG